MCNSRKMIFCRKAGGWAVVPHRNERSEMTRSTTDSRNKCFIEFQLPKAPNFRIFKLYIT